MIEPDILTKKLKVKSTYNNFEYNEAKNVLHEVVDQYPSTNVSTFVDITLLLHCPGR